MTWTVLNSNAFDNNRKRTSVVVRASGGGGAGGWGGATLLVKGADTCVMPFVDRAGDACPHFDATQACVRAAPSSMRLGSLCAEFVPAARGGGWWWVGLHCAVATAGGQQGARAPLSRGGWAGFEK